MCLWVTVCVHTWNSIFVALTSSRSRFSPTTVWPPVRSPDTWRCSDPQTPEQDTLRAPPPEPADPSHTSPPTTAQHTTTGEAQTANPPGQGMEKWRHTLICIHEKETRETRLYSSYVFHTDIHNTWNCTFAAMPASQFTLIQRFALTNCWVRICRTVSMRQLVQGCCARRD